MNASDSRNNKKPAPNNSGSPAAEAAKNAPPPRKAGLQIEALEDRILLSATWSDADEDHHHVGTSQGETMTGDGHDDVFEGLGGNDTLRGGGGVDTADYSAATKGVRVDLGAGTARGNTVGNDVLESIENAAGSNYNDTLVGNSGDNVLSGGGGNDVLRGAGGNDLLHGGDGSDTADFSKATMGMNVDLAAGTADGEGHDTLVSIENVTGGKHADTIHGNHADNTLSGGAGNDQLYGHEGNDLLKGGAGNDELDGGDGSDTVDYTASSSGVSVDLRSGTATGEGTDHLTSIENAYGSKKDDTLHGHDGANTLAGNKGDDHLYGHGGNDLLMGGAGDNVIDGGEGHDTVSFSDLTTGVTVDLRAGTASHNGDHDSLVSIEHVVGSNKADTIHGDHQDNILSGGAGADKLYGHEGNDALIGGAGNDTLDGGGGDDLLRGGAGTDTLEGGTGHDVADYSDATGAVRVDLTLTGAQNTLGAGRDTLHDMEGVVGSQFNDTFAFSHAAGGDHFTVDGGGGSNTIDLSSISHHDAVVDGDSITVHLSDGSHFQIDHVNVDHVQFHDARIDIVHDAAPVVHTDASAPPPVTEVGGEPPVNDAPPIVIDDSSEVDAQESVELPSEFQEIEQLQNHHDQSGSFAQTTPAPTAPPPPSPVTPPTSPSNPDPAPSGEHHDPIVEPTTPEPALDPVGMNGSPSNVEEPPADPQENPSGSQDDPIVESHQPTTLEPAPDPVGMNGSSSNVEESPADPQENPSGSQDDPIVESHQPTPPEPDPDPVAIQGEASGVEASAPESSAPMGESHSSDPYESSEAPAPSFEQAATDAPVVSSHEDAQEPSMEAPVLVATAAGSADHSSDPVGGVVGGAEAASCATDGGASCAADTSAACDGDGVCHPDDLKVLDPVAETGGQVEFTHHGGDPLNVELGEPSELDQGKWLYVVDQEIQMPDGAALAPAAAYDAAFLTPSNGRFEDVFEDVGHLLDGYDTPGAFAGVGHAEMPTLAGLRVNDRSGRMADASDGLRHNRPSSADHPDWSDQGRPAESMEHAGGWRDEPQADEASFAGSAAGGGLLAQVWGLFRGALGTQRSGDESDADRGRSRSTRR